MRLNWKILRLGSMAFVLLVAGCSGINASKSISPIDFLLPGVLRNDRPPNHPDSTLPAETPVKEVAQL